MSKKSEPFKAFDEGNRPSDLEGMGLPDKTLIPIFRDEERDNNPSISAISQRAELVIGPAR